MKNLLLSIVTLLLVAIFFTSCNLHIEKRRYRPGYHIETFHQKKSSPNDGELSNKKQSLIQVSTPEYDLIQPEANLIPNTSLTPNTGINSKKIKNKNNPTHIHSSKNKFTEPCDQIILKNGSRIEAKIEEMTENEIKYKRCNFLDGPTFVINKSKIDKIEFKNGDIYPISDNKNQNVGSTTGASIASLVLGILAAIFLIIGIVLVFTTGGGFSGLIAATGLAPAGLLSLTGLIIGASQLKNNPGKLALAAFLLNLIVQVLAIIFTILMFFI